VVCRDLLYGPRLGPLQLERIRRVNTFLGPIIVNIRLYHRLLFHIGAGINSSAAPSDEHRTTR
jgi:hypothetical protein